jgi:hypothetical protein
LQKSQAIKRGLRQYHQKRRRSSRKNPDNSDEDYRKRLQSYGLADPPKELVITRIRYVARIGDWYILVEDRDWYWYDPRDKEWKFLPYGPIQNGGKGTQDWDRVERQCAWCKRVWRDGAWRRVQLLASALVTHGMYEDCAGKLDFELEQIERSEYKKNTGFRRGSAR